MRTNYYVTILKSSTSVHINLTSKNGGCLSITTEAKKNVSQFFAYCSDKISIDNYKIKRMIFFSSSTE